MRGVPPPPMMLVQLPRAHLYADGHRDVWVRCGHIALLDEDLCADDGPQAVVRVALWDGVLVDIPRLRLERCRRRLAVLHAEKGATQVRIPRWKRWWLRSSHTRLAVYSRSTKCAATHMLAREDHLTAEVRTDTATLELHTKWTSQRHKIIHSGLKKGVAAAQTLQRSSTASPRSARGRSARRSQPSLRPHLQRAR